MLNRLRHRQTCNFLFVCRFLTEEIHEIMINGPVLRFIYPYNYDPFSVWMGTVLFTSLIGDSIILLATIKYRAIKQHKVVIAVMQHMAVCDLLQTIFRVLPMILVTCIGPHDLFSSYLGEVLFCHILTNTTWITNTVTIMLTCALTMLKLVIVKYPLRTRSWSSKLGHKICTAVWLLYLVAYAPVFVMKIIKAHGSRVPVEVYEADIVCWNDINTFPDWLIFYFVINNCLITVLSFLIVLVSSVILLVVAKKAAARHGNRLRWEGISTVLLTVGVLLLSQIPYIFQSYFNLILPNKMMVVFLSLSYLNIMANFFIYALTLRSFRTFLKLKIIQILSSVRPATIEQRTNARTTPNLRKAPIPREAPIPRATPNLRATPAEGVGGTSLISMIQLQGLQTSENTEPNIQDTSI